MQANLGIASGETLRSQILKWLDANKTSRRELSRRAGCEPNFITSYLGRPPAKWSIPKHPTFGKLLVEIGVSQERFDEMVADHMKEAS